MDLQLLDMEDPPPWQEKAERAILSLLIQAEWDTEHACIRFPETELDKQATCYSKDELCAHLAKHFHKIWYAEVPKYNKHMAYDIDGEDIDAIDDALKIYDPHLTAIGWINS